MFELGKSLIDLRIASRAACSGESGKGSSVTLRTKVLFLLAKKNQTPPELIEALCLAKSNLALLCNRMVKEQVIKKQKDSVDKRAISYIITEKGKKELEATLQRLEERFKGILTTEKEYADGVDKFNAVLDLLSFI